MCDSTIPIVLHQHLNTCSNLPSKIQQELNSQRSVTALSYTLSHAGNRLVCLHYWLSKPQNPIGG